MDAETEGFAAQLKSRTDQFTLKVWATALLVWYSLRLIMDLFLAIDNPEIFERISSAVVTIAVSVAMLIALRQRESLTRYVPMVTILIVVITFSNAVLSILASLEPAETYRLTSVVLIIGVIAQRFSIWLALTLIVSAMILVFTASIGFDLEYVVRILTMHSVASWFIYLCREPLLSMLVSQNVMLEARAEEVEATRAAQERFVANCTHELRTPMTGVLGVMSLLRQSGVSDEQVRLLDIADTSAKQMLRVVDEILTFSKIGAGEVQMDLRPSNLIEISTAAWRSLEPMAKSEGLFYRLKAPEGPCFVMADSKRVEEVLINLLGNAIKFTQSGGVELIINLEPGEARTIVEWKISDTGVGIPKEELDHIFEPFSRTFEAGSKSIVGSGLGLTIARELVNSMGGEITVDSEVGLGSTFQLRIPFEVVTTEEFNNAGSGDEEHSVLDRSLNVLVAEDNALNKMLIEQMLSNIGWEVKVVANGQLAVEEATRTDVSYDIVLLDIQMPVLDGVSAAKMILEEAKSPPALIAFTANTLPADVQSYLEAGMSAVIGKPLQLEELIETVSGVLAARKDTN